MATTRKKNTSGLVPFNQMSEERHKELSSRGGIKSGEAKREKRLLRDTLLSLLDGPNVQMDVCTALIQKCKDGDTKAFEVLRDTIGQKPVDKQEIKKVDTEWFIDDEETEDTNEETGIDVYNVIEIKDDEE